MYTEGLNMWRNFHFDKNFNEPTERLMSSPHINKLELKQLPNNTHALIITFFSTEN